MARSDRQDFYTGIPRGYRRIDEAVEEVCDWLDVELAIIGPDIDIYEDIKRLYDLADEADMEQAKELLVDAKNRRLARDIQQRDHVILSEKAKEKMGKTRGHGTGDKLDEQPGK